jgi:hypothetical protein
MERTIPIFQALVEDDVAGRFHRNHGQLGFALKDQRQPLWLEAEAELTKAIEIRGPWQTEGWLLYEFNRAICRIMLDPEYQQKKPSNLEARSRILQDLRAVASEREMRKLFSDPPMAEWIALNKVGESELK